MSGIVLAAELRRTWRLARSYWLEYVSDLALYGAGFLLLTVVYRAASDAFGPEGILSALIGYVTWIICASGMAATARVAIEESRTGTLEQLVLTGRRPALILLSRSVASFLNYATRGFLMGGALAVLLGVVRPVPSLWLAVTVFLMTAAGAGGLGFALAGAALVHRPMDDLITLIWQGLVFLSGGLAPLAHPALALVAKGLPLSWGIAGLRALLLEGATAASLWRDGTLPGLLANTAFYVALGAALFAWGQRRARVLGTLGHG